MKARSSRAAYHAAVAEGATQVGLLKLVYGQLAQDLISAADAARRSDIEARCRASEHALLLLGHVESWIEELREPPLMNALRKFYSMLRSALLNAQCSHDPGDFEKLANWVLEARLSWQAKEAELQAATYVPVTSQGAVSAGISFRA